MLYSGAGLGTFRAAPWVADSGAVAAGASRQGSCGSTPASRTCAERPLSPAEPTQRQQRRRRAGGVRFRLQGANGARLKDLRHRVSYL